MSHAATISENKSRISYLAPPKNIVLTQTLWFNANTFCCMSKKLLDSKYFINRELSWLEFNHRVLEEAQDPTHPLLERVKFLCIVSSNLDEFFEIRVAGLKQQIENKISGTGPDGLTPPQTFQAIRKRVLRMTEDQYRLWNDQLLPALTEQQIRFSYMEQLDESSLRWTQDFFHDEIYPVLTPLAIDPSHPFPQLLNKSLNIIVTLEKAGKPQSEKELRHAIVQVPRVLSRLIPLPTEDARQYHFLYLNRLISHYIGSLFPGSTVHGAYAFRVTRNSDLYIDEEEALNLLSSIEEELRNRNKGAAVRLEIEEDCPPEVQQYLLKAFNLTADDLYIANGPINLLRLMPICQLDTEANLKDKPYIPITAKPFQLEEDIFKAIRDHDILLHHPYESFTSVVDFLEKAAADPRVLAIKMTLYRTSGDSQIVKALINAAENGKQVTVLVELRARFDEANNIAWARRMEEAGIHVVYGMLGLKTHCKTLLIVRRDEDRIRHYVHLGTGNYHPKTARLYTDLGLFTIDPKIADEIALLFNTLTGMADYPGMEKILVAPFDLYKRSVQMIHQETQNAKEGKPARIFVKMNALVDEHIIEALYEASQAGVKIDLLIRGICCLKPGLPGISDHITVRSIVDRYLEHSRILYFENNGNPKIYIGSADWMPRNLYRRIEVMFPVESEEPKNRILHGIFEVYLRDNTKARIQDKELTYLRPLRPEEEPAVRSQVCFMEEATQRNTLTSSKANTSPSPPTQS